ATPFFLHDPPPTASYPLSLHDALPISVRVGACEARVLGEDARAGRLHLARYRVPVLPVVLRAGEAALDSGHDLGDDERGEGDRRSEEHTSELQSLTNIVCRLLLEKKNV